MLIIDFGLFKLVRLFDKTIENVCTFDFIFECYPNINFSLFSVFYFYFYFSSFGHADIELMRICSYLVHILISIYIYIYILKMFSAVWVLFLLACY